jgi:HK97 family phage portal protein
MVQSLTASLKRPRSNSGSKGAPILSPSQGQNGGGWGIGNSPDITQFRETFQPDAGIFSPGYPLVPVERERMRGYDYPVGYNYIYTPRSFEPIGFAELRALGQETITRLCIETRKDQIEALEWTIKPRDEKNPKPGADARIEKLTEFWRKPDGYHRFATWLRQFLEDMLVIDAPCMELRRNRIGDIIGIDYIDGATIKVLIDETGRRPVPPAPAYEQVIHGRPWVLAEEGRISTDAKGTPLWDSQILYMPRNTRGAKAYGFSPVEQVLITINTELRRQVMQLQHFTEGNVPPGMISAPDTWNPEQVKQYQEWFDSILAGNTASRTRLLWGPAGAKYQAFKEAPIKDNFDEWLARIICFAFSLPPTAFVQQMNRATAQTAQETALEEGLAPLMGWVKRMVDTVIQDRMGQDDLEFSWSDVRPVDPQEQSVILSSYVKDGIYTLNEARDQLGMDPVEGGDEPMLVLGTTAVLVRDLEQMSAQTVAPPPAPVIMHPGAPGAPGEQGNPPKPPPGAPGEQGNPPPKSGEKTPNRGKAPATPADSEPSDAKKPPAAAGKNRPAKKAVDDPEVAKAGRSPFGAAERSASRTRAAAQLKRRIASFFKAEAPRVAADCLRGAKTTKTTKPGQKVSQVAALAKASIDKADADYVDHPVAGEQCSGCTMFDAPNACSLVRGDISPGGHCRFFEAKEREEPATSSDDDRDALLAAALEAALAAIDFRRWTALIDPVESTLRDVGADAFNETMSAVGAEPDAAAATASADEYAKRRAAELVAAPIPEPVVPLPAPPQPAPPQPAPRQPPPRPSGPPRNYFEPAPEPGITQSTSNMIRPQVLEALRTKMTVKDLAQALTASRAFSEDRAELIANWETTAATHAATLQAFKDSGKVEASIWATMEDELVESICEENANAGPVPLGELFPSGDYAPMAHPNCRCWLEPVLNGESGLWSDTLLGDIGSPGRAS